MNKYLDLSLNKITGQSSFQTSIMNSALVTPDNYFGMEEWYIPIIECPKCKHKVPAKNSNYCSGCGIKLKLSTTVQQYVDKSW